MYQRGRAYVSAGWPRILMYHAVADLANDPNLLCTSPERFKAQMLYLKRRNLRGVSMQHLRRAMKAGDARRLVGLTFDDGYEDFLHTAVPILESCGFTATVFAVVDMLGEENDWKHSYLPSPRMKLLGLEGLREASQRGMEVGSHGMTHANLLDADPQLLSREVRSSRRLLGEMLGEEIEGFCYPYGSYDGAAVRAAREAGYAYACGWKTYIERSNYDLPRIPVSERDGLLRLATKLRIYPQYAAIKRIVER
jgi:peptidoglycan/xylan/chitin deacetylase (PgdA/CDA1 family)